MMMYIRATLIYISIHLCTHLFSLYLVVCMSLYVCLMAFKYKHASETTYRSSDLWLIFCRHCSVSHFVVVLAIGWRS